ncbi:hypothetical protein K5E19_02960 [Enterobacter sp. RIT637]|uniref:hypothetical protein n=1 Tax=Enterobacter sp. RIT637 TaxID=2870470 RepID=UPI001C866E27|nr:hypothetical protein [Enterobacter sp. RIT637]MBX8459414.1 hypothetical protein [Enterobacter sp. RIT637]
MKRVKTWAIRAAITLFMAIGGMGAGQVFSTDYPDEMPYTAATGCALGIVLCYFMFYQGTPVNPELQPTLEVLIENGISDLYEEDWD